MGKEFCEFQLEYWLVVSMQAMASTFYFYIYCTLFHDSFDSARTKMGV